MRWWRTWRRTSGRRIRRMRREPIRTTRIRRASTGSAGRAARPERTSTPSLLLKLVATAAAALLAAAVHAEPAAPARAEMLARGEEALQRGEVDLAGDLFTQAGFIKHAADAEIGLVRAYMQAGEYRRALNFAAHTAGAHPDPAGKAIYAQLLDAGGQDAIAARLVKV